MLLWIKKRSKLQKFGNVIPNKYFIKMKNKTIHKVKEYLKEISKTQNTPHSIAGGFALGSFLALLPTLGFGIFIGLLLLLVLKKINKIAMFIAFAIWNPLVLILLYPVELAIGNALLADLPTAEFRLSLLNQFFIYSGRFLLGSIIVSTLIASVSYIVLLTIYTLIAQNRKYDFNNIFSYFFNKIK